jgi:hypothetical protein
VQVISPTERWTASAGKFFSFGERLGPHKPISQRLARSLLGALKISAMAAYHPALSQGRPTVARFDLSLAGREHDHAVSQTSTQKSSLIMHLALVGTMVVQKVNNIGSSEELCHGSQRSAVPEGSQ